MQKLALVLGGFLAVGCGPAPAGPPPDARGPESPAGGGADAPAAGEELFGAAVVHAVEVRLSAAAVDSLAEHPREYVEGDVTIDGEVVERVGVRLKSWASFRPIQGKASLKLDFNRYVSGQKFRGEKALVLNNMVSDPSFIREYLAYTIYRQLGVPAPKVGYAWVKVNGEDRGLYAVLEAPDKAWLTRNFEDPSGNLYEGDPTRFEDGSFAKADFAEGMEARFDLEVGRDVGRADISAITRGLRATSSTHAGSQVLEPLVDLAQFHRQRAIEVWVGQWDGYHTNQNNYRVYFDPARGGRAVILPWGHDLSFQATPLPDLWAQPVSALGHACALSPECEATYRAVLEDVGAEIDRLQLDEELASVVALLEDDVERDPKDGGATAGARANQAAVRRGIAGRTAELSTLLAERR